MDRTLSSPPVPLRASLFGTATRGGPPRQLSRDHTGLRMTTRDAGNGGASGQGSSPPTVSTSRPALIGSASRPGTRATAPAQDEANHGASAYIGDCPVLVELIKNDSRRREIVTGP